MRKKLYWSFHWAIRGIWTVWKSELSFKIQTIVGLLVLCAMIFFGFTYEEFCFVLLAMVLVLGAEMLNTIVEDVLDIIEPRVKVEVGRVKDIAAGVVLLLSCFAVAIGILTLLHHFQLPNPLWIW